MYLVNCKVYMYCSKKKDFIPFENLEVDVEEGKKWVLKGIVLLNHKGVKYQWTIKFKCYWECKLVSAIFNKKMDIHCEIKILVDLFNILSITFSHLSGNIQIPHWQNDLSFEVIDE